MWLLSSRLRRIGTYFGCVLLLGFGGGTDVDITTESLTDTAVLAVNAVMPTIKGLCKCGATPPTCDCSVCGSGGSCANNCQYSSCAVCALTGICHDGCQCPGTDCTTCAPTGSCHNNCQCPGTDCSTCTPTGSCHDQCQCAGTDCTTCAPSGSCHNNCQCPGVDCTTCAPSGSCHNQCQCPGTDCSTCPPDCSTCSPSGSCHNQCQCPGTDCSVCGASGSCKNNCQYPSCDVCSAGGSCNANCPGVTCSVCAAGGSCTGSCPPNTDCNVCTSTGSCKDHCTYQSCSVCGAGGSCSGFCPPKTTTFCGDLASCTNLMHNYATMASILSCQMYDEAVTSGTACMISAGGVLFIFPDYAQTGSDLPTTIQNELNVNLRRNFIRFPTIFELISSPTAFILSFDHLYGEHGQYSDITTSTIQIAYASHIFVNYITTARSLASNQLLYVMFMVSNCAVSGTTTICYFGCDLTEQCGPKASNTVFYTKLHFTGDQTDCVTGYCLATMSYNPTTDIAEVLLKSRLLSLSGASVVGSFPSIGVSEILSPVFAGGLNPAFYPIVI